MDEIASRECVVQEAGMDKSLVLERYRGGEIRNRHQKQKGKHNLELSDILEVEQEENFNKEEVISRVKLSRAAE